jgi:uncharacterized protein
MDELLDWVAADIGAAADAVGTRVVLVGALAVRRIAPLGRNTTDADFAIRVRDWAHLDAFMDACGVWFSDRHRVVAIRQSSEGGRAAGDGPRRLILDGGVTMAHRSSMDTRAIEPLLGVLRETWAPSQVWLFGSRARGTHVEESDWDVLAVVDEDRPELTDPLAAWDIVRRAGVRADLVACSAEDFAAFANVPNTLAYEATHHGRRLA